MEIHKSIFFCIDVNVFGSSTAQLAVVIYACFWFAASYVGYLGSRTKRKKQGVVRFMPSFTLFALIVRGLFMKLRNLEAHSAQMTRGSTE